MFLINCDCGCFFTLKKTGLEDIHSRKCPNCGKSFALWSGMNLADMENDLPAKGITVRSIPDDAKVSVTFTV